MDGMSPPSNRTGFRRNTATTAHRPGSRQSNGSRLRDWSARRAIPCRHSWLIGEKQSTRVDQRVTRREVQPASILILVSGWHLFAEQRPTTKTLEPSDTFCRLFTLAFETGSFPDGERKPSLIAIDCFMCRHAKFRPLASHGTP
jgi:hypothetical protein